MTSLVFDASALVAWMLDEPAADEVTDLLGRQGGACSAVNAAEVVDRLLRRESASRPQIDGVLGQLATHGFEILDCTEPIGLEAGAIRSMHYHRVERAVSLADCVAVATAAAAAASLVTSDGPLAQVAVRSDVEVVVIPNSRGERAEL